MLIYIHVSILKSRWRNKQIITVLERDKEQKNKKEGVPCMSISPGFKQILVLAPSKLHFSWAT